MQISLYYQNTRLNSIKISQNAIWLLYNMNKPKSIYYIIAYIKT